MHLNSAVFRNANQIGIARLDPNSESACVGSDKGVAFTDVIKSLPADDSFETPLLEVTCCSPDKD
jgi:hypothetical protein